MARGAARCGAAAWRCTGRADEIWLALAGRRDAPTKVDGTNAVYDIAGVTEMSWGGGDCQATTTKR